MDSRIVSARRAFLNTSTKLLLSGTAIALLAGKESLAQGMGSTSQDVNILNVALGLEHEMGGTPVAEKKLDEYASALMANTLKSQADVLDLAARLELGATNAYLGVIPAFKDPALAKIAGRLAADETMHWTLLNNALARSLPSGALTFGA